MSLLAAAGALAGAGGAALAWGTLVERRWFALRHLRVPALREPGTLRVLHLSDLHLLPWQDDKLAFVRACAQQQPDIVVATGDLLGHAEAVDPVVACLNTVAEGRTALLVLGSNDFFAPSPRNPLAYFRGPSTVRSGKRRLDTDRLVAGLAEGGWRLMDNARKVVKTPVGPVDVAGLGDPHIRRDRPDTVDWSPPQSAVALRLGLVHAPYRRALRAFGESGHDLVLAGHTHGGQVRLPGFGALVANCDLPLRQTRGLSPIGQAGVSGDGLLHVSAGLGTSMYAPVRFACRPEATLLELTGPGEDPEPGR